MRPSGIHTQIVDVPIATPLSTAEVERIARLYPPEVVHERYWKGGYVKRGIKPEENNAIDKDDVTPIDWTIRELYRILPPDFKRTVLLILMMRNRPECPLSVLPTDVLLYLLEFSLPVKVFRRGVGPGFFEWVLSRSGSRDPKTFPVCTASSIASEGPSVLLAKSGASGYTCPIPNSWVCVDIAPTGYRLCCTGYSYSARMYGGTPRALRNWEFQGSEDGREWHVIRKHVEDPTIPDVNGGVGVFYVDSKFRFYTKFRILQTGPNAYRETGINHWQDNYAQLNFGNMELWGIVFVSLEVGKEERE